MKNSAFNGIKFIKSDKVLYEIYTENDSNTFFYVSVEKHFEPYCCRTGMSNKQF